MEAKGFDALLRKQARVTVLRSAIEKQQKELLELQREVAEGVGRLNQFLERGGFKTLAVEEPDGEVAEVRRRRKVRKKRRAAKWTDPKSARFTDLLPKIRKALKGEAIGVSAVMKKVRSSDFYLVKQVLDSLVKSGDVESTSVVERGHKRVVYGAAS